MPPASTRNPAPSDLGRCVMKFCSDGTVRIRGDDECTVEGDERDDYTFFIICPATAVRCKK